MSRKFHHKKLSSSNITLERFSKFIQITTQFLLVLVLFLKFPEFFFFYVKMIVEFLNKQEQIMGKWICSSGCLNTSQMVLKIPEVAPQVLIDEVQ